MLTVKLNTRERKRDGRQSDESKKNQSMSHTTGEVVTVHGLSVLKLLTKRDIIITTI